MKITGYKAKPGFIKNPMFKFPRNEKCYCESGLKAKKCCLPKLKPYIKETDAEDIKRYLKARGML